MKKLELININKTYELNIPVLKNISFFVDSGDFLVLLGPSGSGKSTILSIIAGFEPQNSGDVFIDGNNCNKKPCQDRDVAMVFQNYALYPCMNVYNNIAFPLINRHEKKEIVNQKVRTIAKTLHIEDILKKKVDKISGGQKQRVAIGRALVREPTLLLLDEPLSNLDAVLRTQMRKELFNLHSQFRITMVYVTHDQSEALSLATKIIVLDGGEIQQIGTPQEIYDFPQNEFVATFIGSPQMNFFKEYNVFTVNERVYSVCLFNQTYIFELVESLNLITKVDIGVRGEDILLFENNAGMIHITHKEFLGDIYVYHCEIRDGSDSLPLCVKTKANYNTSQRYDMAFSKLHIFDSFSKKRIQANMKNKEMEMSINAQSKNPLNLKY